MVGKPADEFIVAEIELVEESKVVAEIRDSTSEVIRISMEESDVGQLINEAIESEIRTTKAEVIEAHSGHRVGIEIGNFITDESFVAANVSPFPCLRDLIWVILDSGSQVLNSIVCNFDPWASKWRRWWR